MTAEIHSDHRTGPGHIVPGRPHDVAAPERGRITTALRLWTGLSPASRRLIVAGVGILLITVAAVWLTVWNLRSVALDNAGLNVSTLGRAVAEQTARSVQAVDLSLQEFSKAILAQGVDTPERFRTVLNTKEMQALLQARASALPQANAFSIVGADGMLVNFSRQWPIPVTNLSDRDYYLHFRDTADPAPFIGKPVQNRGDGVWTVFIVRRVESSSGRFLGLVLGAIELDYFRYFYRALTAGAGTTVRLLSRDGTVLTTFPPAAEIGAVVPATAPWHNMVAQRLSEPFETDEPMMRELRVVSAHSLADYPLVVDVSVSKAAALQDWRRIVLVAGVGTCAAALCVALLLRALIRQFERLERSERSLVQQNTDLVGARMRMERQAEELRASQGHLARESAALSTTLDHMGQGIIMVDSDRVVVVCNALAIRMLDLPPELMASRPLFDEVSAYQRASGEFSNDEAPAFVGRGDLMNNPVTYERRRPNGRILQIESVPLPNGGLVRTYTDITERRLAEEQIRYLAHYDDLTKLVNRVMFRERLDAAVALADRTRTGIAVLYLDLDGFKLINDTWGHEAGDRLLAQVAVRLRDGVRDTDTVARMGGDEFAIIQGGADEHECCSGLARRLIGLMAMPFVLQEAECRIGVSIGIARYPDHGADANDLLRHADTALYRAKSDGRGVYRVFVPAMSMQEPQTTAI